MLLVASKMNCPICLAEYHEGDATRQMPCSHSFHSGCILPWLQKVCNLVLVNITMSELILAQAEIVQSFLNFP